MVKLSSLTGTALFLIVLRTGDREAASLGGQVTDENSAALAAPPSLLATNSPGKSMLREVTLTGRTLCRIFGKDAIRHSRRRRATAACGFLTYSFTLENIRVWISS
jgi:hypothetical protein